MNGSYPRLLTERDLEALPDDGLRHELEAGFLVAEPQPFPLHAQIQTRLVAILDEFVRPRGLGEVLSNAGFLLARDPDTVRGPDVSFVARDRWVTQARPNRFFPGAPDLAIEILSPSNRAGEMRAKAADYLSAGSQLVWIVNPDQQSVTAYRSLLAPQRLFDGDELSGEGVLPGFTIGIDSIFKGSLGHSL